MSNILISTINLLVLLFAAIAVVAFNRARRDHQSGHAATLVILFLIMVGVVNAYLPSLVSLRENVVQAQPVMVLALTAGLLLAGFTGSGRSYFRTAEIGPLVALHGWRLLFGVLLLFVGLSGGLPATFFWSAAVGDMVAGLWALSLWQRSDSASGIERKLWSAFGLLDLLHLLPNAVFTLPPFYADHPELLRPILLPLLGVPMLIALQVMLMFRFFADDRP